MSVIQAKPPVEIEVNSEVAGKDIPSFSYGLARHVGLKWEHAKRAKMHITERLLKCERQRRGIYDPDKAMEISQQGGSDIFMMLTDIKCRSAESWIKDVMMAMQDRPFTLVPAENPVLPPETKQDIMEMVKQEANEFLAMGAQLHPDTFRMRIAEVHDQIITQLREEAKERADRMGDVIEDQLTQGNWDVAFRDFVSDFVTYPTAILKGPVVRKKKRMEWGPEFTPIVITDFAREVERVHPADFFPAPNMSTVDKGDLIERHRLTRDKLVSFRGVPGYNTEEIDQVLTLFRDGYKTYLSGDQERHSMEGKPNILFADDTIEALEYWGSVPGSLLIEWGMSDGIDEHKEYEVNAWSVANHVIKCVLNPDPLGRRPYEIACWEMIPGSVWGLALPEIMRDLQMLCNAAARALANNMGIASGPQADVTIDRLAEGEQIQDMYPWRIWQTTSDKTGGGQSAIRFFQPDMKAAELMAVYQQFARQCDEVTGIPAYIYSTQTGAGAGRTASGLSMLMDNASKGIKAAIATLDKAVSGVVHRFYIHNMMFGADPYIKGDFAIVPRGAMGILIKEQLQVRRQEFLQATANPVDLQIIGVEGRAYLLREIAASLQMDTDKIVPSPEQLRQRADEMKMMQMQQAQAAQAQMQQTPAPQETPQPALPVVEQPQGGMQ